MSQQSEIQDIYPLSFMQEGMLFHSLFDEQSRAYFEQASFTINGRLDLERFQKVWMPLLADMTSFVQLSFTKM